jgi:uncharacterized membrane protein YfhO
MAEPQLRPRSMPRETVRVSPETAGHLEDSGQARGKIESLHVTRHRIEATIELDAAAMVTVAQPDYPGLRAEVDGRRVPIWTANYAFQAFPIAAGRHEVSLRFRSTSFEIGLIFSIVCLIGCVIIGSPRAARTH